MPQPLPSKEASLFRQVVKCYEQKQHKKGIKAADQVLKKHPDHGDTQAMKALILNAMTQSDEAFALAKAALKNDMKSHVCWHVYGLLWRSQHNYEEAIKAYKFALKIESESLQILRDLSLLQVQMRDFQGYIESRRLMLQKRQVVRQNWTALAVAHHLAGELKAAENVLALYEGTLKSPPPKSDVEHSEAVLYKNTIIAEMGDTERALEHLESVEKNTLDRTAIMEMRAAYLLKLERKKEAEQAYRDLLARNPEYRAYYEALEKAMGLSRDSDVPALQDLYNSFAQKHERIDAARRIPLDFLEGESFREAADHYLRRMLQKGVPSTFNNIKSLYSNEAKRNAVQDLVESYASEKQVNGASESGSRKDPSQFEKSTLYFLAQHYNFKLSRNLSKALSYVEKLIELSPKTYDYHMTKARILKHFGNFPQASKIMNEARELDTRDRYINTKCAKYQLREDKNDEALSTMSKFTRNEVVGGTLGDLTEMQALWYLLEDGEAYERRGKFGMALKRYHTVFNIFETWQEDQFDFHTFSLRKAQIRAYIDMMRWEDRLRSHPFYARCALDAMRVYLKLHEQPDLKKGDLPEGVNGSADPKEIAKARKQEERKEAERLEADKKAAAKKSNVGQDGELKRPDDDPKGQKLLGKDPLSEATKFLAPLLEFGDLDLEAQHLGFEIYMKREKYYLALKCLITGFKIAPDDPSLHTQAVHFRQTCNPLKSDTKYSSLLELADSSLPEPYNSSSTSPKDLNDSYIKRNPNSASHLYAFTLARQFLEAPSPNTEKLRQDLTKSIDSLWNGMSEEDGTDYLKVLKELGAPTDAMQQAVNKASETWSDAKLIFERQMS